MVDVKIIEKIRKEAKDYFSDSSGSHGWDHVERVYNLAVHIGEKERANLDVVKIAALLHDIAREKQDRLKGEICHAEEGAEMAEVILAKHSLPEEVVKNVIHAIRTHRSRGKHKPESLEAKIVAEADKLDAVGAVGVGRCFMFAAENGAKLHNPEIADQPIVDRSYTEDDTAYQEYLFKLKRFKSVMQTKEGKRIAKERLKFMESFFETLNREYQGFE